MKKSIKLYVHGLERALQTLAMLSRETDQDQWFSVRYQTKHEVTIRSSDVRQPGFVLGLEDAIEAARVRHQRNNGGVAE